MGNLMLNGISYTGGSGGTNVVPNPPETATDDLTSVKIDNTVYNLAGGSNVYGAFIDTNRVIKSATAIPANTDITYTATEDCAVIFALINAQNQNYVAWIDGISFCSSWGQTGAKSGQQMVYLKKGQTIKFNQTYTGADGSYEVYGLSYGTQNIFAPQIYSLEEREIGVWFDNKPLYSRVFDLGSDVQVSYDSLTNTSIDASNMEKVVDAKGFYSTGATAYNVMVNINNNIIRLQTDRNGVAASIRYVLLFYTKTTDVAGSGSYNTLGVPMTHYTTDEQVVGTYLGKPLYQRVITPIITANTTLAGDIKYGSVALGDYINSVDMAFVDLSASYIEPATGATRGLISAYYEKDSGNIVIVTMFTRSNSPSSLCIKYTKITD